MANHVDCSYCQDRAQNILLQAEVERLLADIRDMEHEHAKEVAWLERQE